MKEKDLERAVAGEMRRLGWMVSHFHTSSTAKGHFTPTAYDAKGFPDLVAVRERLIVVELKVPPNKLSVEQETWLERLAIAGVECHVWTPKQWQDGTVDFVLSVRS